MERKKNIFIIIAAAVFFIVLSANIYSSVKSHEYRRLCNQYRAELVTTEATNRELADRIGRVAEITERIAETSERNVTDAREIIERIEILRAQIKELEDCCGGFNQLEYYHYWDSYYRNEQLME